MSRDLIERLRDYAENGSRPWIGIEAVFTEAADEITRLRATVARTMTDPQRMIWADDVKGICRSPDMCFEYGEHARCGPCAIDQATVCGVVSDLAVPNLPEVSRLQRENNSLRAELSSLRGEGEACDLCQGSGRNMGSQLWPEYPPPCRACRGTGKAELPTPDSDVIRRLVGAVRAFMPTGISYSNPNIPDDVMIPLDVTMGELRAINAALASIPSTTIDSQPDRAGKSASVARSPQTLAGKE
ncbi:MAG: hypothetical protein WA940_00210 [Sphingopyxis sp.]